MSMILVVEPDPGFAAYLADSLRAEGWTVTVTEDRASALERAATARPQLVLVDVMLPDARSLLGQFSTERGGPGSMALIPAASLGLATAGEYQADGLVPKPFSEEDLRKHVGAWLRGEEKPSEASRAPSAAPTAAAGPSMPLSSDDLFGDILAEVEADLRTAENERRSSLDDDLERRLEKTLSGVLDGSRQRPKTPATPKRSVDPRGASAPAEPANRAGSEVDALLESTLGPLARQTGKAPAPPRAPSVPKAPVEDLDALATRRLPTMPVDAGEPFGDYSLLERIAVGGMAEVWRARRRGVEGFQKTVAIKRILSHLAGVEDFVSMLVDEAKLAAQLNHTNITQIYDLGKVDGDFFIAMEYVDGMDLRSILNAARDRDTPLPIGQALSIAAHLARALDYAHRKRDFDGKALNLVHRDISPQNVLISYEGEIKLCDFGIARAVSKVSHTQMGTLKGKLQYMSPEQAWGKKVDARTDIFSLGSVLFELLTGSRLFSGDSEISILDAVRDCRVPPLSALRSEIPENVERVVQRALAKDPGERYPTAGDLDRELAGVLETIKPSPAQADLADFVQRLRHGDAPWSTTGRAPRERTDPTGSVVPHSDDLVERILAEEPASASPPRAEEGTAKPAPAPVSADPPVAPAPVRPTPTAAAPAEVTPALGTASSPEPPAPDSVSADSTAEKLAAEDAYGVVTGETGEDRTGKRGFPWLAAVVVLLLAAAAVAAYFYYVVPRRASAPATVTAAPGPAPPAAVEAPTEAPADEEAADETSPDTPPEVDDPAPETEAVGDDLPPAVAETASPDAPQEPGEAQGDPALDIEGLVSAEIERRAAKLREDFERERRQLQDALVEAQTQGQEGEPPAGQNGEPPGTEGAAEPQPDVPPPPPPGG